MAVHLTRIYTRTGDAGSTTLGDMSRVAKTDPRVGAFADCDETNSAVGVALALGALADPVAAVLRQVQNDLFDVGADLCTPVTAAPEYPPLRVTEAQVERLERWCDEFNEQLPTLDSFILPGGTPGAALLHQARTVARRAERSSWLLVQHLRELEPDGPDAEPTAVDPVAMNPVAMNPVALRYLNRLSDLLFILARAANGDAEVTWVPGGPEAGR